MADLELKGYTLGQKHQQYNKLVLDAVENNRTVNVEDFNLDNSDLNNLLNIDIASRNKNVDYILRVLTCDDMLYVSRAIKQSDWLIKDPKYAYIIEPEYLRANLFPLMCPKAIIKLNKHIRDIIDDEKRAEHFYCSEENPKDAVKWLPRCSLNFVEKNLANHIQHIKYTLLRRLCEKSITILEIYITNNSTRNKGRVLQINMFLLVPYTDKYLDLVETVEEYEFPTFNKRATSVLMKKCRNRIVENFHKYHKFIHLPTFITCLKQENIKNFLLNQAEIINENSFLIERINFKHLMLFLKRMPQEIRFEFVKEVFIDKKHESKESCILSEKERKDMSTLCCIANRFYDNDTQIYIWYQFAPFNLAFQKIKDLITSVSFPRVKISMLKVVLTSTQNNLNHEHTFLEYLRDVQKNATYKIKEEIVTKLLSNNNYLKYDSSTWSILSDIFQSMDINTEINNPNRIFIESILLYKLIHREDIPDIIQKKFNFNSLLPYHKKLNADEKEIVFTYLYDVVTTKLLKCTTTTENEFKETITTLEQVLNLLKDFKKELEDYPSIICKIKDLVNVKTESSWTVSMETLFNIKKSWRKILFEQSLTLYPTESALLNALKHGPSLLHQNQKVIQNMFTNDKMSLRHVFSKMRIYWSGSFAKNIILMYTEKLNALGHHKATTRGLSILLPRRHLKELVEKYTPKEAKIDWAKIDEVEFGIQQQFAKNMHNGRPQPFPEIILGYAKGDYLQYALPSLLSIFYNLNSIYSQKYIPSLLDAPVSLQKHGIRLAVYKLELSELLSHVSNIWNNNKNASIRSVMFKVIYHTLCKEKDLTKIRKIWELIEMFIDNLTFQEDKAIYKLLFKIKKVPLEVRGSFCMKSYKFLHKLIYSGKKFDDYEYSFRFRFSEYCCDLIEQLHPDFVDEVVKEFIDKEFTKKQTDWDCDSMITLISSYLLCATNEQTQLERFEKTLLPILKQSFALWNKINDDEYFIRKNMAILLNKLRRNIETYVVDKKMIVPSKMLTQIQMELSNTLTTPENYMLLTKWKLTVAFVTILDTQKPILNWKETSVKIANEFGKKCSDFLIEDCNKYFPRIYLLFVKALQSMLDGFVPGIAYVDIYSSLVRDESFIPGYLAAIKLISKSPPLTEDEKIEATRKSEELCKHIFGHKSAEIKLHYYSNVRIDKTA